MTSCSHRCSETKINKEQVVGVVGQVHRMLPFHTSVSDVGRSLSAQVKPRENDRIVENPI